MTIHNLRRFLREARCEGLGIALKRDWYDTMQYITASSHIQRRRGLRAAVAYDAAQTLKLWTGIRVGPAKHDDAGIRMWFPSKLYLPDSNLPDTPEGVYESTRKHIERDIGSLDGADANALVHVYGFPREPLEAAHLIGQREAYDRKVKSIHSVGTGEVIGFFLDSDIRRARELQQRHGFPAEPLERAIAAIDYRKIAQGQLLLSQLGYSGNRRLAERLAAEHNFTLEEIS